MRTYIPLLTTIIISCGTVQSRYLSFREMDILHEIAQEGMDALQEVEDRQQRKRYERKEERLKEYIERRKIYENRTPLEQMRRLEEYNMIEAICNASLEIQAGTVEYQLKELKGEIKQAKIKRTIDKDRKRFLVLQKEITKRIERSRLSLAKCGRIDQ